MGFSGQLRNSVENALSSLESVQLEEALESAARLREEQDPFRRLPELGRYDGGNAGPAVRRFVPAIRELLDQLEAEVAGRIRNIDQDAKDLQNLSPISVCHCDK